MSVSKKVSVKVTGGMRFAAVDVEAQGIPLRKTSKGFSGSRSSVTLTKPGIDVFRWIKGGTGAKYTVSVTINGKTKEIKGAVGQKGFIKTTKTFEFSDFGL